MKTTWKWAAVLAATAAWACGGGNSLPGGDPGGTDPGPGVVTPADKSLWPLTQGSWWMYTITESDGRTWQKRVVIEATEAVPGTSPAVQAVKVRSTQPQLEEVSWQVERDGLVVRVREEDYKQGALASVSTWDPVPLKALARPQALGWSHTQESRETVTEAGVTETKTRSYTWRVVAVDETVTTPAGTFTHALKVQRDRVDTEKLPRTYWLVPGVGKVREEGVRTEVLTQYYAAP